MQTRDIVLIAVIAVVVVAGVAVLLISSDDPDVPSEWDFPEEVTAEDRDYPAASAARSDFETQMKETASKLADPGASADDMIESIDALAEGYLKIHDWYSWALKDYYLDTVTYNQSYIDWTELVQDAADSYFSTVKAGLNGSCGSTVEKALESEGADPETYRSYNEMSDEEKELNNRATELETRYDEVMAGTYSTAEEQYTAAAEVYIQLVQVNNDLAQLKGYDDYAGYAYSDVYGRDYTPDDAKRLSSLLSPASTVMFTVSEMQGSSPTYSSSNLSWMDSLSDDGMISAVRSYTDTIADRYSRLMDYLLENDLIFLNQQTDNGLSGQAYTTDLLMESSVYILINGYHGSSGVSTIAHEFGHGSAMSLNRELTSCMDVDEIHSNGMEALFATSGASSLNGCGRAMSAEFLYGAMSTIVTGILYTEIELYAYETEAQTGTLTVDMLRTEFESLLNSAGLSFGTGCDGLVWTEVPHLFSSPMYYVSYVTANMDAVDIFVEAATDHDRAEDRYLALVGQKDVDGYVEAVEKAGLVNAFDISEARSVIAGSLRALRLVTA